MTSDVIRCDKCGGRKSINGLGGMSKQCDKCTGIGYITIVSNEPEKVESAQVEKKKPGRKKKVD